MPSAHGYVDSVARTGAFLSACANGRPGGLSGRRVPWGAGRLVVGGSLTALLVLLSCASGVPPASVSSRPTPRSHGSLLRSSAVARKAVMPSGRYAAEKRRPAMPTAVKEIVADRTAFTSTWRNADGSLSVRRYLTPHFYRTTAGTWASIDPRLSPTPGQQGWWKSGANNWSVAFGPVGARGGAVRFTAGTHTFGFAPQGVRTPLSCRRCRAVWPSTVMPGRMLTC